MCSHMESQQTNRDKHREEEASQHSLVIPLVSVWLFKLCLGTALLKDEYDDPEEQHLHHDTKEGP